MNLFEKIAEVSAKIRNIEKNTQVGTSSYGYKAVSDVDVVLAVKDAEKEFRLVSIPIKQELVSSEIVRTLNKDGKESLTHVDNIKMTLRIVDLDEPTHFVDIESFGKGIDSGDKGFGKASTYARKYALLNAYKIATGSDPDEQKSEEKQATATIGEKKLMVINYLENNLSVKDNVLKHFNVQDISDLKDDDFNKIHKTYKAKGIL
jgi:hypothetical protein